MSKRINKTVRFNRNTRCARIIFSQGTQLTWCCDWSLPRISASGLFIGIAYSRAIFSCHGRNPRFLHEFPSERGMNARNLKLNTILTYTRVTSNNRENYFDHRDSSFRCRRNGSHVRDRLISIRKRSISLTEIEDLAQIFSTKVSWFLPRTDANKILNFNQMKERGLYADVIVSIGWQIRFTSHYRDLSFRGNGILGTRRDGSILYRASDGCLHIPR